MATKKTKKAVTLEAPVYTQEGKRSGTVTLPEKVFGLSWNADLVHQVVVGMQANARLSSAHTKGRGEVRGGGKKPWRQKGTGRARHGSSRSPIWRKGGVTHGPRNEKEYSVAIPRRMRAKALATVIAKKYQSGAVLFLDKLTLPGIKAKIAKETLKKLGTIEGYESVASRKRHNALIALPEVDANVKKSFQNFGNVIVTTAKELNALDAMKYKTLVMVGPEVSMKTIETKLN